MSYTTREHMSKEVTRRQPGVLQAARSGAGSLTSAIVALWVIHAMNALVGGALNMFGIIPRSVDALWHIAAAPFLHGSFSHLLLNSVSLVMLGAFTMLRRRSDFLSVSVISAITSGLGAWFIGAPGTIHIGASGVIFGYLGFLMARGLFERSLSAILLSAAVGWFFGGMLWGVLPTVGAGISWEAHLFGFLGGVGSAGLLTGRGRRPRQLRSRGGSRSRD